MSDEINPTRKQQNLTALQNLKFGNFIMAEFEKSKMGAPAFAVWASEKLGFSVNEDHVRNRVREYGLTFPTRAVSTKEDTIKLIELENKLNALRDKFVELERVVDILKLAAKHNKS